MPITRDPISGKPVITKIPENLKWGKPIDFVKALMNMFVVVLPLKGNNDFVVTGSQVPTEDDKSRLWVADQKNGSFLGFFRFIKGQWRRIFNLRADMVIWMVGDSRDIPEGFQLIDGTVSGIDVETQNFIKAQFRIDPTSTTFPIYTYFACRYIGP